MQILGAQHPRAQRIDERVARIAGVEDGLAAHIGQTQRVAVATDATHHTVDDTSRVRGVGRSEAQLIHHRDRPCAHRHDVADDAAHAGRRALIGLHVTRVVVRLHLEGDRPPVTHVDDAGVLPDPGEHARAHLIGGGLAEVAQMHLGRLVTAVLRPHHRVHRQLGVGGSSAEDLANPRVLVVLETEFAEGLRLVGSLGGDRDGIHGAVGTGAHVLDSSQPCQIGPCRQIGVLTISVRACRR